MRTRVGRRRLGQLLGVVVAIAVSVALGMPPASATTFWASGETVVYSHLQLSLLSPPLPGWPDGEMGVETNGSAYFFYAANRSSQVVRSTGTLATPASLGSTFTSIQGVPGDISYKAGGPVYTDPSSGMKLLVTHLERHPANGGYYSTIGLSKSTDDGASWTFLGEVFAPNSPFEECTGIDSDAGSGTYAIRNDGGTNYFYMYVHDRALGNCTNQTSLSVLREPVADVVAAASSGTVSSWAKYYNGTWSTAGLGGASTDVWPDSLPWGEFGSVSWNTYLNKFVLVFARAHWGGTLVGWRWWLELTESSDGLTWSMPVAAAIKSSPGQWIYPTIIGLGSNPRETGQSFHVYYVSSTFTGVDLWNNNSLVRRSITFA